MWTSMIVNHSTVCLFQSSWNSSQHQFSQKLCICKCQVKIFSFATHFIKQFHFPSQDLLYSLLEMRLNKNLWVFIWISSCDSHFYKVGASAACFTLKLLLCFWRCEKNVSHFSFTLIFQWGLHVPWWDFYFQDSCLNSCHKEPLSDLF